MSQSKANRPLFLRGNGVATHAILIAAVCTVAICSRNAMAQTASDLHESERSDKVTGGHVEGIEFDAHESDIRVTLNVPSFRLTLWQNGREVKSYFVGVGLKDHPIYIGDREATEIIWNPACIPPASDWVREMKGISPGEVH